LIVSVGLLVLLGAGCGTSSRQVDDQVSGQRVEVQSQDTKPQDTIEPTSLSVTSTPVATTTTEGLSKNVFRREDARKGDRIVGMTIASIGPRYTDFKGQVTLHGQVSNLLESQEMLGGNLCFWVDKSDWGKVPRIYGDERDVWFCFTNIDAAAKVLAHVTSTAVTIDDYQIDSMESEVFNRATFVK
jgi:hypothetical protein